MTIWMTFAAALALQEPQQDLEKLRKESAELRERLTLLERQALDDAEMIQRLRQIVKRLELQGAPLNTVGTVPSEPGKAPPAAEGPVGPVRSKIEHVDRKLGFVVIGIGERQGVKLGYRFEIVRAVYASADAPPQLTRIGEAEFEKYIGDDKSMSKLKVVQGSVTDMREGDEAVAHRKLQPVPPPQFVLPAPDRIGAYKITGQADRGHLINGYGSNEGARQTDVVYVYRNGKHIAKLRLDIVEKSFSVGSVIEGSQIAVPETGDTVVTRELRRDVVGKVVMSEEKRGIMVNIGEKEFNVRPGMKFEVRRQGKRVGTLVLKSVDRFWSYAEPDGETKASDIEKGDFVELIEEKRP